MKTVHSRLIIIGPSDFQDDTHLINHVFDVIRSHESGNFVVRPEYLNSYDEPLFTSDGAEYCHVWSIQIDYAPGAGRDVSDYLQLVFYELTDWFCNFGIGFRVVLA